MWTLCINLADTFTLFNPTHAGDNLLFIDIAFSNSRLHINSMIQTLAGGFNALGTDTSVLK